MQKERITQDSEAKTTKNAAAVELGSAGGKARAKKLPAERRGEIARAAAIARWTKFEKDQV